MTAGCGAGAPAHTVAGPGTLVALGDSMSCGEGVGVNVPLHLTWPALLAKSHALQHVSLARPGARARDVLAERVALVGQPRLVTLLIGLNDVLRSSDCAVGETLTEILSVASRPAGPGAAPTLLVLRLHDPTALLPLPRQARAAVLRRVGLVNAALDQAAAVTGAVVLDLAGLPALQRREAWAVDRLHPSAYGHSVIAAAAAELLHRTADPSALLPPVPLPRGAASSAAAGPVPLASGPLPGGAASPAGGRRSEQDGLVVVPGRLDELVWLTRHGFPYLAVHGRRMVPGLVAGLTHR